MQKLLGKLKLLLSRVSKEDCLKYFTAGVLLSVPLYPKFPFLLIPGTYVSVRLEDFVVFAALAAWFLYIYPNWKNLIANREIHKRKLVDESIVLHTESERFGMKLEDTPSVNSGSFIKDRLFQVIFLFWAVGLISVLSGIFVTKTAGLSIGILHFLRRIEYMIPFFIGMASMKKRENLSFYIKIILIVVFFVFLYGVAQKYFSFPIVITQNAEYAKGRALYYTVHGHLVSTFAGHYDLATFLILVTPVLLTVLLSPDALKELALSKSKKASVAILLLAIFQSLWLLVYSASRISIVSYIIAVSIPVLFLKKYWAIPIIFITVFVFTLFSGNLINRYQRIFEIVKEKITYEVERLVTVNAAGGFVLAAEDRSSSIRLNVEWPRAIRAFTKNPFLGTGYSSITLATDNDYLRLFGEMGILGFLLFFLVFFRLLIEFFEFIFSKVKTMNLNNAYVYGIIGAVPGIFLNAVFIDVFEASKFAIMFWLLMGFAVGTIRDEENN